MLLVDSIVVNRLKAALGHPLSLGIHPGKLNRYLSLLQAGASHHGVDESYQSWLARLPSVTSQEAATSPERINTPSRILVNRLLALLALITASAAAIVVSGGFSSGFVNDT